MYITLLMFDTVFAFSSLKFRAPIQAQSFYLCKYFTTKMPRAKKAKGIFLMWKAPRLGAEPGT